MKKLFWLVWLVVVIGILAYYGNTMFFAENKQQLLIGDTTHGHFQIELACNACHEEAFGGIDVLQNACMNCHAEELEKAHDSHPKKKFTDPRNADRLEIIDARYCVSCHTEHKKEQTLAMGLTLPKDYCFHCHEDIGEERESHKDLAFDSCASAGCHNYHDNRALYEDFLLENAVSPWLKEQAHILVATRAKETAGSSIKNDKAIFADKEAQHPDIHKAIDAGAHGQAGMSCGGCHAGEDQQWVVTPNITQCKNCHQQEAKSFTQGKHGMRLAQGLSAMTPMQSNLDFHKESLHLEQSCNSCHDAHNFDRNVAATESCLNCHADKHSLAFTSSPHANVDHLLTDEPQTSTAITCATCHMPRLSETINGKSVVHVQHNQNDNLRPNEKMIRSVCMNCHSLEFSIDALAEKSLIDNNFNGKPSQHIPSIDWAKKRETQ